MSNSVIFISAGLIKGKKDYGSISQLNQYLNVGALSLANTLKHKDYQIILLHGDYKKPEDIISFLSEKEYLKTNYPICLSIPSIYAVQWASDFCKRLKSTKPELRIIAGGRGTSSLKKGWLKNKIPEIDYIHSGYADSYIESFIKNDYDNKGTAFSTHEDNNVDYKIIHEYQKYNPSVEIYRGCGKGCYFCIDKNIKFTTLKNPIQICDAIENAINCYEDKNIELYLEASHFKMNKQTSAIFSSEYNKRGLETHWRCESRVDSMDNDTIENLFNAGLRVIDVGLESGSAAQIRNMGKAKNPDSYLAKACSMLEKCKELGIWTKINIMLYPGETLRTIEETSKWLSNNKRYFKGVSIFPLTIYGNDKNTDNYLDSLKKYGAVPVSINDMENNGYCNLHLSNSIKYEDSIRISRELSKEFMTDKDYFDLKSFGYFERGFDYQKFRDMILKSDSENLPFTIT